jgi:hypothetical protein
MQQPTARKIAYAVGQILSQNGGCLGKEGRPIQKLIETATQSIARQLRGTNSVAFPLDIYPGCSLVIKPNKEQAVMENMDPYGSFSISLQTTPVYRPMINNGKAQKQKAGVQEIEVFAQVTASTRNTLPNGVRILFNRASQSEALAAAMAAQTEGKVNAKPTKHAGARRRKLSSAARA